MPLRTAPRRVSAATHLALAASRRARERTKAGIPHAGRSRWCRACGVASPPGGVPARPSLAPATPQRHGVRHRPGSADPRRPRILPPRIQPYPRLMATTWSPVEPRRSVDVLHDDRWHRGVLRGWRRGAAGWEAFVDVTPRPGYTYLRWVTSTRCGRAEPYGAAVVHRPVARPQGASSPGCPPGSSSPIPGASLGERFDIDVLVAQIRFDVGEHVLHRLIAGHRDQVDRLSGLGLDPHWLTCSRLLVVVRGGCAAQAPRTGKETVLVRAFHSPGRARSWKGCPAV